MQDQHSPQPESNDPALDPSIWRGLTQRRMSRRQMLRAAGTGAGALGVSAFLAACGVKGATVASPTASKPGGVGSASWWAKQKLHHTVNFANWPYYIDVLKGKHPSLEHFTQPHRHPGQLHRGDQRQPPVLRQDPAVAAGAAVHRLRHHRDDQQQPAARLPDQLRLADPARPERDGQLPQVREPAGGEHLLGPGQQVHDGLAVGLDRDRLQRLGRQGPGRQCADPVRPEVLRQGRHDGRPAGTRQPRPAGDRRRAGHLHRVRLGEGGQEAADSRRATGSSAPTTTRTTSTT